MTQIEKEKMELKLIENFLIKNDFKKFNDIGEFDEDHKDLEIESEKATERESEENPTSDEESKW